MNKREYLLSSLGEEASEIAQLCSKSNRFGLKDVYEGSDNVEKLVGEINDFFALLELCKAEGLLPWPLVRRDLIAKKKKKVAFYMRYARKVGALKGRR